MPLPAEFQDVERSGPPSTRNGSEWEVPLSGGTPQHWVEAFHNDPGEWSSIAHSRFVKFQNGKLIFNSSENNVRHWIELIDKWIARSNAAFRLWLDKAHRAAEL